MNIFSDWLLVANSIFQGLLAVAIAYWGNRIHRTAWMGGLFMLQGILCFMVIIPVLIHKYNFCNNLAVRNFYVFFFFFNLLFLVTMRMTQSKRLK